MIEAGAVAAVLLAAGQSHRFGSDDKLMTPLDGKALVWHAAQAIIELGPAWRIAVCPDQGGPVTTILAGQGFEILVNAHAERGMSESLRLGLAAARSKQAHAALICLADMPFVRGAHLRSLLAAFDPITGPIVASSRDGVPLPPALFGSSMFAAAEQATGDQGSRSLIASARLVGAPYEELADIDRPADLPPNMAATISTVR